LPSIAWSCCFQIHIQYHLSPLSFKIPLFVAHCIEKMLLNIKCAFCLSLQLLSETFVILRRIYQDMIINVYRSLCKVPIVIVRF
jgi:hypothetical protein